MSDNLPQTIGIDISKASLDCHVHPAGAERQFANTAKGHKALIAWLRQWPVERIAYEATATYHRALEAALADWPCVKLNPERARRFAQATGTLAKTDRIDAMLLARMAATLQPPVRPARSAQQAQMAELINARDGLVRDRTALALYMPALVAARYNPDLKAKYQQLVTARKPAKIAITAVMRKLVVTANALLKADRCWTQSPA
ncbi:IS110 family transposase [Sphingobium sp. EP60837]|uniref:IS110 family transposase n=1 Tax=Sphingobium sp. EP60837 TaxID=1855519 RepID=UPI00082D2641|nr:transposase [Sphingobium sp. EP60837]